MRDVIKKKGNKMNRNFHLTLAALLISMSLVATGTMVSRSVEDASNILIEIKNSARVISKYAKDRTY